NLDLPRQGLLRQQLVQWRALAKYLPQTDLFHFYFGKTLVPKSLNVPILKAARKRSVMHFLGDDIRWKPLDQLEYRKKFDATIVGSYAATRWVPDATAVVPRGLARRPVRGGAGGRARAAARRACALGLGEEGHALRRRGVRAAPGRPRRRPRGAARRGGRALQARRHRRRPAALPLARGLRDRGDGLRQAGRHTPRCGRGAPDRGGVRSRGADRSRVDGRPRGEAPPPRRVVRAPEAPRRGRPRVRRTRPRPAQAR